MIQEDIFRLLSEDPGVISLVNDRIYPIEIPQGAHVPSIVYTAHIVPVKSLSGESGLDNGIIEIRCWAKTYMTAHLIANAVRSAFHESGIGAMTDTMKDVQDPDTRNHCVVMTMNVWSESNGGGGSMTLSAFTSQMAFVGDGVTTEFTLPKFRSGSLLVFFNGRLAKKGEQSDLTAAYFEKSTYDSFVFRVAPQGGDYADEILAFFEKV